MKKLSGVGDMNGDRDSESEQFQLELQAIITAIYGLAQSCQRDTLTLLALLRTLESLHREIRDGIFQASLPDNRQELYALLKNIEEMGGWPYIDRMRLQKLLVHLPAEVIEVAENSSPTAKVEAEPKPGLQTQN